MPNVTILAPQVAHQGFSVCDRLGSGRVECGPCWGSYSPIAANSANICAPVCALRLAAIVGGKPFRRILARQEYVGGDDDHRQTALSNVIIDTDAQ
jgi:hypothetical protein